MSATQMSSVLEGGIRCLIVASAASTHHSESNCAFGSSPIAAPNQFPGIGSPKAVNWKHESNCGFGSSPIAAPNQFPGIGSPKAVNWKHESNCAFGSSPIAAPNQFPLTWSPKAVNWKHDSRLRSRILCMATTVDDAESSSRLPKTSPFKVLGLDIDCDEEDVKAAFRNKVKEFHPDVYKGTEDADTITKRLIQAYELLIKRMNQGPSKRRSNDPFDDPECKAEDVFVNELSCIGRGCPYSCAERAPQVFKIATDTDRARAVGQGLPGDYSVHLAVGQCPRNCIYYVTPLQREILEQVLERSFEGIDYYSEVALLEDLIARASYANGRYTPSKRKSKVSTKWVDWY